MALSLYPTLADLRADLFTRLGMETQGGQASPDAALFDSWLRQANKMLWLECDWLRSRTRFSVDLVTGSSVYDWPDNVDEGSIEIVEVEDENGKFAPLACGISSAIRNLQPTVTASRPQWFDVHDDIIEILPAPDATYPRIWITAELGPSDLRAEGDRCDVDPEALLQMATIMGREHFEMGDTRSAEKFLARYIQLTRAHQGPPRSYQAATRRYVGPPSYRWRQPRAYTVDWNPW